MYGREFKQLESCRFSAMYYDFFGIDFGDLLKRFSDLQLLLNDMYICSFLSEGIWSMVSLVMHRLSNSSAGIWR